MPRDNASAKSTPAEAVTQSGPAEASPLAVKQTELAGVQVGPFEIKGFLGSGGFGEVFLAEQHDPVHRLVALKMLAPDRRSARFREQFDAERRVLAQVDHPNVARMLDAGTTKDGRDWVAVEYVPGHPITTYCNENRLSLDQRIRLLQQVARAVDFAHEKGVVHRDLKPSNVLVSVDGGREVAKIIDFGIARVMGTEIAGAERNRALGTPGFMAPEQGVSAGADADARADVYALGALLYVLSTDQVPAAAGAALMSECLSTLPAAETARIAEERRSTPRELMDALRGDLDWIADKCLDHDRMRRYADAGALVEDLRRWHAQRPVDAAPQSVAYRVNKFVARNRAMVLVATILGGAFVLATVTSVLGWKRAVEQRDLASQAEDRASQQAVEARAAASFISGVVGAASLNRSPEGTSLTVVDWLNQVAKAADTELKDRPATDAAVRLALGRTYTSLGLLDQAEAQLVKAIFLAASVYTRESSAVAESLQALAEVSLVRGQLLGALARTQEARAILERLPGENGPELARNSMLLAQIDFQDGKSASALRHLATADLEARSAKQPDQSLLSSINWYRSLALLDLGRYSEALAAIDRNLDHNRANLPSDHWWIAESETVQAAAMAGMGSTEDAWTLLQAAMPKLDAALRPTSPPMRLADARAAFIAERAGHPQEATMYRQRAVAESLAPVPPGTLPLGTPGMHANQTASP